MTKNLTIKLEETATAPVLVRRQDILTGQPVEDITLQPGCEARVTVSQVVSIGIADLGILPAAATVPEPINPDAAPLANGANAPTSTEDPDVNPTTPALAGAAGEGEAPTDPQATISQDELDAQAENEDTWGKIEAYFGAERREPWTEREDGVARFHLVDREGETLAMGTFLELYGHMLQGTNPEDAAANEPEEVVLDQITGVDPATLELGDETRIESEDGSAKWYIFMGLTEGGKPRFKPVSDGRAEMLERAFWANGRPKTMTDGKTEDDAANTTAHTD